jgi:hypothetical protein
MRTRLAEVLASTRPDVVHVEDIHMAQYVLGLHGTPLVLDMHNIESLLLRRYADRQRDPLRKAYARLTAAKLRAVRACRGGGLRPALGMLRC